MIELETPTRARLKGYEGHRKALARALTYTDGRVDFELSKTRKSLKLFEGKLKDRLVDQWGSEKYDRVVADLRAKVEDLTGRRKQCLLFEDAHGLWTYSGLAWKLARASKDTVVRLYDLPERRPLPYQTPPRYQDRPYQVDAHDLMLAAAPEGPCGIELPTGAGKSTVIRNLLKTLGLPAVVMAPSTSIAGQLYDAFAEAFGKKHVGLFGDGKREYQKLIVVGIDDSLAKVEPGSPEWEALSAKAVFVADESHLTPAASLQKVCLGLCAAAPYRFFVSATQMRNDGLDLVLQGITGRLVLRKTLRELVDAGYLARPVFKMVRVESSVRAPLKGDPNKLTRSHLYYNPLVNRLAAEYANNFVELMQRPTLILVEELEQFKKLLPHLKHEARFAHGPLTKETRKLVPCYKPEPCCVGEGALGKLKVQCRYHGDDPADLVERFNRGEFPVLVGTSCIATGTDIQAAEACVYLRAKASPIVVAQSVGRETRGGPLGTVYNPWTGKQKLNCVHVDFRVANVDVLDRHAALREELYAELYAPAKTINKTHLME